MIAFDRLPGTKLEGEHIAAMLNAELWTEGDALDARLKKIQSPRILHLSTHGFFSKISDIIRMKRA
jgi:CHAT domain-containing protein